MAALLLSAIAALSLLAWLALLLHPARPWDMLPSGEPDRPLVDWPDVVAIVPARNEADILPATLPALLGQSYPGSLRVVLVDDRSTDGTADVARFLARSCNAEERLEIVHGTDVPEGWIGKPWAMEQGLRHSGTLDDDALVLFTDADILHSPRSVRRLVAECATEDLALDSRMALLHCRSFAERLLAPAFAWFFAVLYPMRRVNDPSRRIAAAAGGCMLLPAAILRRLGGLAPIRDRVIDDVSLAREVKSLPAPIRLARSRGDVRSLRRYDKVGDFWRMVRRSAFTELRHSWLRLGGSLAGLALAFLAPPLLLAASLLVEADARWMIALPAALAWATSAITYLPAVRAHDLHPGWALTLPLAGLLHGAMTIDSALRHARGRGEPWRAAEGPGATRTTP